MGWARGLVGVAATGVVAAGAGYAVAAVVAAQPTPDRTPAPMLAEGPTAPQDSPIPLDQDPDYPPLAPGLELVPQHFGAPRFGMTIEVPDGWARTGTDIADEWNLRPALDMPRNTYVIRIKIISGQRALPAQAVQNRIDALAGASAIARFRTELVDPARGFDATYVDVSNGSAYRRLTYERFVVVEPLPYAQVEIAGTGRLVDREGLSELVDRIAASVTR